MVVVSSSKTASRLRLFGLRRQRWHVRSARVGSAGRACQELLATQLGESRTDLVPFQVCCNPPNVVGATSVGAQLCGAPRLPPSAHGRGVMFEQEPVTPWWGRTRTHLQKCETLQRGSCNTRRGAEPGLVIHKELCFFPLPLPALARGLKLFLAAWCGQNSEETCYLPGNQSTLP